MTGAINTSSRWHAISDLASILQRRQRIAEQAAKQAPEQAGKEGKGKPDAATPAQRTRKQTAQQADDADKDADKHADVATASEQPPAARHLSDRELIGIALKKATADERVHPIDP